MQQHSGHVIFLLGSSVVRRVINYNNPILKIQMHEQVFQKWSIKSTFLYS